ncbi:hypothetical protein PoB_002468200, partial [Plakobranchus ocellatus]
KVGTAPDGKEPTITSSWKCTTGWSQAFSTFVNPRHSWRGSNLQQRGLCGSQGGFIIHYAIKASLAYITDNGYDLDLLFNLGENKGHIYSDVEGSEMTNYLFFDEHLVGQDKQKNLKSAHRPEEF